MKDYQNSKFKSYRVGLDYVPTDNWKANLHEGEAVLTKKEAMAWRNGTSNMTGEAMANPISKGIVLALNDSIDDIAVSLGKVVTKMGKKKSIFQTIFGIDGSHYSGLNYVPYDGYIAELHKGEAVVPQKYNTDGKMTQRSVKRTSIKTDSNSELLQVIKEGFEAVIKKIDNTKVEITTKDKTSKAFDTSSLYNIK